MTETTTIEAATATETIGGKTGVGLKQNEKNIWKFFASKGSTTGK